MLKRSLSVLMLLIAGLLASCAGVVSGSTVETSLVTDKLTFIHFYSDECPNCMMMVPIVQGLGTEYHNRLTFEFLNIDAEGKSLYDSMGLRGNPIFLILKTDGTVVYKGYGRVPELALDKAIRTAIGI